jgi:hypothetical protein
VTLTRLVASCPRVVRVVGATRQGLDAATVFAQAGACVDHELRCCAGSGRRLVGARSVSGQSRRRCRSVGVAPAGSLRGRRVEAMSAQAGPAVPRLLVGAASRPAQPRHPARLALAIGALGVVFGDIGTSPLYRIVTVFDPADPHPVAATRQAVFGVISLIFWSVMIIVTLKYVLLVMHADNDGEGGILALITLIRRRGMPGGHRTKVALAPRGIFGASLFFGDSMITPAISVLVIARGVSLLQ